MIVGKSLHGPRPCQSCTYDRQQLFCDKKADSTADWPVSTLAQRSMYMIQARTKPPTTTSIAEKDCYITMAAKVKLGTRNWKDRSAICWHSRFKTSAVYKREGRAWP